MRSSILTNFLILNRVPLQTFLNNLFITKLPRLLYLQHQVPLVSTVPQISHFFISPFPTVQARWQMTIWSMITMTSFSTNKIHHANQPVTIQNQITPHDHQKHQRHPSVTPLPVYNAYTWQTHTKCTLMILPRQLLKHQNFK